MKSEQLSISNVAKTQVGLGELFQAAITAVVDPEKLIPPNKLKDVSKQKKCRNQ